MATKQKTYKIQMKASAAGPAGQFAAGKTYDVSATLRKQFVEGGYAVDFAQPAHPKPAEPDKE